MSIESGRVQEFDLLVAMPLGLIGDQLAYVSPSGGLMSVRFNNSSHRPVGDPLQLDEGILFDPMAGAKASLSASGTLAYLSGRAQFQPVIAAAGSDPVALIREPGNYSSPRFSPDGRRVAISVVSASSTDIWIYDTARNTFTRLTNEGSNIRPEWTQDGRHLVFISLRGDKAGIWRQASDGSGSAELLYQPDIEPFEALVSPDMKWLVFRTAPGARLSRDILAVPLEGQRTVVPVVTGPETESLPRLSPDGRWLVYQSNESGRFEIYVRPFPGSGARIQVSDNGGTEALWARSGRTLYYRGPIEGEIVAVDVTMDSEFSIGERRVVLTGDYLTDTSHPNWDVSPSGQFLMLKRAGAESQTIVVHNWGRELRERTAARK
jgi:serine/threonine-protein kinase